MCGRFASTSPADEIRAFVASLGPAPNHPPSWNVAPTQLAPVCRRHPEDGGRRLDRLEWGLVPGFVRDPKGGRRPFNARAETIATAPMFRGAFRARRCLVPMDAFYEWRAGPGGRQPYAIARADGAMLAMAGVWEARREPDGSIRRSFAIATTEANATMRALHHRMPVVLEREDWPVWLGEAPGDAHALLRPAAEDRLRIWPVSTEVNAPRHDHPGLLDPVALPEPQRDPDRAGPDPA